MVAQVSEVIMAHHFDDDLLVIVTRNLKVALGKLGMPQPGAVVTRTGIDVARDDEFATL